MRDLNKPQRYNVASIQAQQTLGGDVMESHPEGQYVTWRDYDWLLQQTNYWRIEAETDHARWLRVLEDYDRLRASSFVTAVPSEEYERLKDKSQCQAEGLDAYDKKLREAESMVERLRKAGDAMARIIQPPAHGPGEWDGEWDAWQTAKDGKPTD